MLSKNKPGTGRSPKLTTPSLSLNVAPVMRSLFRQKEMDSEREDRLWFMGNKCLGTARDCKEFAFAFAAPETVRTGTGVGE